ncbi:MAG: hypothetical protein ABSH36_13295 [Solirubrobacteraceae bacterium]
MAAIVCVSVATSSAEASKKGELVNESKGALKKNNVKGTTKAFTLAGFGEAKIICGEGVLEGKVTSTKGGEGKITFKGCEVSGKFPGTGCATGTEPETITFPLLWGYVEVGGKDVWEKTIKPETEIVCGAVKVAVKGAFLSQVTPEGELTKEFTLNSEEALKSEKETLEVSVDGKSFEKAHASLKIKVTLEENAEFI